MATPTSALTLTSPQSGRRRLLTLAGGIILAGAAIVGLATTAVINLAASPTGSLAIDRTPLTHDQLHQHVLRENGAAVAVPAVRGDTSSMLHQHVLRENGAAVAGA
jgi:hypothetical protein